MNIAIVKAFIARRTFTLNYKGMADKLFELEHKYNKQFKDVYEALNYLLEKDNQEIEQKTRKKIGF